jgi:hypothetical protein
LDPLPASPALLLPRIGISISPLGFVVALDIGGIHVDIKVRD